MPIDSIGGAQNLANVTNSGSSTSTEERVGKQALGQDEFFKLLTTQLASQDPLEPMEDTAFIAQMASFSELEMTSNLTKSFDNFNSSQAFASAHGYIGKTVSLASGESGEVTSVERQNGQTLVFLNGSNTDGRSVDSIYKVEATNAGAVTSSSQVKNPVETVADAAKSVVEKAADAAKSVVDTVASVAQPGASSGTTNTSTGGREAPVRPSP